MFTMKPEHREFGFIPLMPTGGWAHKAARFAFHLPLLLGLNEGEG